MSKKERQKNWNMVQQCELLDFEMYSLRDVLWFKQGLLQMELPKGIEYPSEFQKPQSGAQKLIRSIFKKK